MLLNVLEQYSFKNLWVNSVTITLFLYIFLIFYLIFNRNAKRNIKFGCRWIFIWLFYFKLYKNFVHIRFDRFCLILVSLFIVVLWFNLISTWTFTYSFTGIFFFTTILASCLIVWIFCVVTTRFDLNLFSGVTPQGIPGFLIKSLISVEGISYIGRLISLNVRLFINIVSGHLVLKLLLNLFLWIWCSFQGGSLFLFNVLNLFILIFAIFCLEVFVSFLQAYIFFFLVCIYLQDSVW